MIFLFECEMLLDNIFNIKKKNFSVFTPDQCMKIDGILFLI